MYDTVGLEITFRYTVREWELGFQLGYVIRSGNGALNFVLVLCIVYWCVTKLKFEEAENI